MNEHLSKLCSNSTPEFTNRTQQAMQQLFESLEDAGLSNNRDLQKRWKGLDICNVLQELLRARNGDQLRKVHLPFQLGTAPQTSSVAAIRDMNLTFDFSMGVQDELESSAPGSISAHATEDEWKSKGDIAVDDDESAILYGGDAEGDTDADYEARDRASQCITRFIRFCSQQSRVSATQPDDDLALPAYSALQYPWSSVAKVLADYNHKRVKRMHNTGLGLLAAVTKVLESHQLRSPVDALNVNSNVFVPEEKRSSRRKCITAYADFRCDFDPVSDMLICESERLRFMKTEMPSKEEEITDVLNQIEHTLGPVHAKLDQLLKALELDNDAQYNRPELDVNSPEFKLFLDRSRTLVTHAIEFWHQCWNHLSVQWRQADAQNFHLFLQWCNLKHSEMERGESDLQSRFFHRWLSKSSDWQFMPRVWQLYQQQWQQWQLYQHQQQQWQQQQTQQQQIMQQQIMQQQIMQQQWQQGAAITSTQAPQMAPRVQTALEVETQMFAAASASVDPNTTNNNDKHGQQNMPVMLSMQPVQSALTQPVLSQPVPPIPEQPQKFAFNTAAPAWRPPQQDLDGESSQENQHPVAPPGVGAISQYQAQQQQELAPENEWMDAGDALEGDDREQIEQGHERANANADTDNRPHPPKNHKVKVQARVKKKRSFRPRNHLRGRGRVTESQQQKQKQKQKQAAHRDKK